LDSLERKQVPVSSVRSVDNVDGIVEAIVSVTNIVDSVNDIIEPGAYKATLKKRNPKGVWSHDTNIPVAKTLRVEELMPGDERLPADLLAKNAGALLVKMQFNLNTTRGRDAYEDVQFFDDEQEWSIGYAVGEGKSTTDQKSGIRKIHSLELFEYSPVIFGAAPNTRTLSKDGAKFVSVKDENEKIESVKEAPERYSDIDFSIPNDVASNAQTGLDWASEYGRGGTDVGKATARYLVNNSTADWRKVWHISAYFARHENEMSLPANSNRSADGYPGNGLIAWKLWGGDPGRRWATSLVERMQKRDEEAGVRVVRGPGGRVAGVRTKSIKAPQITPAIESGLRRILDEHNEKYGDNPSKRVTYRTLVQVFRRGVGAYRTNPQSVRPNVTGPEQWAYARVNSFLYAVRNGKYRSGQHDTDLLPSGHPMSTRGAKDIYTDLPEGQPTSFGTPQGLDDDEEEEDEDDKDMGVNLSNHQIDLYHAYEYVVEQNGLFDQSYGNNGSHYTPGDKNPFVEEGMVCSNCVFYEGGQRCEIVSGTIEPNAICKFWIIPEELLAPEQPVEIRSAEKSMDFDEEEKSFVSPSHSTSVNDTDLWVDYVQYQRMRSPADKSYYRKIFGYQRPDTDGTRKTHYTFVHHFVSKDGTPGAASWSALRNTMGLLNGARQGTVLRGQDRVKLYNHIKRHYLDHGKEVPELKSDDDIDQIMMKKGIIDAPITKEDTNG